jgi:hypothetical protein
LLFFVFSSNRNRGKTFADFSLKKSHEGITGRPKTVKFVRHTLIIHEWVTQREKKERRGFISYPFF